MRMLIKKSLFMFLVICLMVISVIYPPFDLLTQAEGEVVVPNDIVALYIGSPMAFANGKQVLIDVDSTNVVPVIKNDRTLVPIRFIAESFGAEVNWDKTTATVSVKLSGKEIRMVLNSNKMTVNNEEITLEVPAQSISDRTYIPLRALVGALDKYLIYDNGLIVIKTKESGIDINNEKRISEKLITILNNNDTINIGAILPITGPVAIYGVETQQGMQLAIDEINAKGGVLGKQLKLIVKDDEANPEKTKTEYNRLVNDYKVTGILGALTSKCSLAITQQAQKDKIIMVSPTSTNDRVTNAGKYIFRVCYNDLYQGQVVAQYGYEALNAKTAAILLDYTNDYSKGLAENFKQKFESLGGKIVAQESYATGDKDFGAQIFKINSQNPDVLFIPDYYTTVSLIAKQVKIHGLSSIMLGADGWDEITNNAGDEVIGSYYSNHFAADSDEPESIEFVSRYVDKYNRFYDSAIVLSALGYDAAYVLAEAIERAGNIDSDNIQEELMKTDRKFVTGNIKFDENRNPIKSAVMVKVEKGEDGKLEINYAGTVTPH